MASKKKPAPPAERPHDEGAVPVHCRYDRLAPVPELMRALHPLNNNRHPEEQLELLAHIFRETGVRHPVIVSRRSGLVVAGEGRVRAAALLGEEMPCFPVVEQDFDSEAEELAFLSADNRLQELSERDESASAVLIRRIKESSPAFDVLTTGYTEKLLKKLSATAKERAKKKDIKPEEFGILVYAADEAAQEEIFREISALGHRCKIVCS